MKIFTTIKNTLGKFPKKQVRPLISFFLTDDMRKRPKCINQMLRQFGYTSGDKVVVMLEKDWRRIIELAHRKIDTPLEALAYFALEHSRIERLECDSEKNVVI